MVRLPAKATEFSLPQVVQKGFAAHPTSYTMRTDRSLLRGKAADHSPTSLEATLGTNGAIPCAASPRLGPGVPDLVCGKVTAEYGIPNSALRSPRLLAVAQIRVCILPNSVPSKVRVIGLRFNNRLLLGIGYWTKKCLEVPVQQFLHYYN